MSPFNPKEQQLNSELYTERILVPLVTAQSSWPKVGWGLDWRSTGKSRALPSGSGPWLLYSRHCPNPVVNLSLHSPITQDPDILEFLQKNLNKTCSGEDTVKIKALTNKIFLHPLYYRAVQGHISKIPSYQPNCTFCVWWDNVHPTYDDDKANTWVMILTSVEHLCFRSELPGHWIHKDDLYWQQSQNIISQVNFFILYPDLSCCIQDN